MLVLTRKVNQKVHIGPDITLTVTRIDGDRVRIGIDAPPDVFVRREELLTQWDDPPAKTGWSTYRFENQPEAVG